MKAADEHLRPQGEWIFGRALCGVDDSTESLDALRLLLLLAPPDTRVTAIGVLDADIAVHGGLTARALEAELERNLSENLDAAASLGSNVKTRLVRGSLLSTLRGLLREEQPTLIAIGSHGMRRGAGIAIGSVATTLLHEAPCAVLLGRPLAEAQLPVSVIVGTDGSDESGAAADVALALGKRLGLPVEAVVATGGKHADPDAAAKSGLDPIVDKRRPVKALVERAGRSSLLVVGSRGLHGIRALGSVSERVAHEAHCSVLVVRAPNR